MKIFYFSSHCPFSRQLLANVQQHSDIELFCIDGFQTALPKYITMVPTLQDTQTGQLFVGLLQIQSGLGLSHPQQQHPPMQQPPMQQPMQQSPMTPGPDYSNM